MRANTMPFCAGGARAVSAHRAPGGSGTQVRVCREVAARGVVGYSAAAHEHGRDSARTTEDRDNQLDDARRAVASPLLGIRTP